MSQHVRDHQEKIDNGDNNAKSTAFQWRGVTAADGSVVHVSEDYQEFEGKDSPFVFPEEAAFYASSLANDASRDTVVSPLFTPAARDIITSVESLSPEFGRMILLLERYNKLVTPQVSHGFACVN